DADIWRVTPGVVPGYGSLRQARRFEESHGIEEEEGRQGWRRRDRRPPGRPEQPIRAARGRGRRAQGQPAHRLRLREEGLRAHVEREGPREGHPRRQEDAEGAQGGRELAEGSGRLTARREEEE